MTNNIEKLYELANITCKYLEFCESCIYLKNNQCISKKEFVEECLPFTPEKQLELIKWLSKHKEFRLNIDFEEMKITEVEIWTIWTVSVEWYAKSKGYKSIHTDFSQVLAGLVCELWEDLTDEQREEVRGILR